MGEKKAHRCAECPSSAWKRDLNSTTCYDSHRFHTCYENDDVLVGGVDDPDLSLPPAERPDDRSECTLDMH
jgi:hypothetical protein